MTGPRPAPLSRKAAWRAPIPARGRRVATAPRFEGAF
jgi:hypothetical protein